MPPSNPSAPASAATLWLARVRLTPSTCRPSNLGNLTIDHWNINWGDGSPEQQVAGNLSTATHVYQDNGDYQIAATAVDNNGVAHAAAQNPGKLDPAFGGTGTVLQPARQ